MKIEIEFPHIHCREGEAVEKVKEAIEQILVSKEILETLDDYKHIDYHVEELVKKLENIACFQDYINFSDFIVKEG